MRHFISLALLAVSVVACGASSDSSVTGPVSGTGDLIKDAPGTYVLNVPRMPLVQQAGLTVEVTGGAFTISSNFTYSYTINFKLTRPSGVSSTQSGSSGIWKVLNGTVIDFYDHKHADAPDGISWDATDIVFDGTNLFTANGIDGFFDVDCSAIASTGGGSTCAFEGQFFRR